MLVTRFASELAGRAALRTKKASPNFAARLGGSAEHSTSSKYTNVSSSGLAEEMIRAGWLD